MPETDWVALVHAVAARDQSALHALYDRAHSIVFTLALRITRDRATAEEITLDVFHEVWRRAPNWDASGGSVVGWIANIARSRAIDRVRFERRKKRREHSVGDALDFAEPQERDDAALREGVASLTPGEREVIERAFGAGLTHAEVAEALNLPLGTVKTRIRSGLQKLRRALDCERTG